MARVSIGPAGPMEQKIWKPCPPENPCTSPKSHETEPLLCNHLKFAVKIDVRERTIKRP